ncbi:RNA-binding protein [Penicillium diatomitis]|uniref:RNA-binding protein n=1 Tax=Penicillium diatomitis TaxID=2819901 RepID=A0A9W9WT50_9EURO|nr:RNA-binding protein [Penicillium diatomitis]KAJ5475023.1 RNA-binding protein [Penicillium diatomitis]
MFIGGLNWETTDQSLRDYFSQFGEVQECTVMRDSATGRSRGFGFLTFRDPKTVNTVMVKEHYLDGKIIDPKRAIPRDEQEKTSKIFVGGVSQEATEQDFKQFFTQFGRVIDATLMIDKDTGRPRGFGFVTFDSEAAVENAPSRPLEILGKQIEVKKAQPRGNLRDENRGGRGGRDNFRDMNQGGESSNVQQQGGSQQGMAGGMTPQMMAQYWQRMQQYFAMMQQQMAMGGGQMNMGAMNPAMMQQMQQMQMKQMAAQMGGGPQQQQQVQQQPQSQQQQQPGGMSPNPASPGSQHAMPNMMNAAMMQQMQGQGQVSGGGQQQQQQPGGPGYNAQEQIAFEQQKYEQQQARRAMDPSRGYAPYQQGGPTSWEGMYDEVPQPNIPTGPQGMSRGGSMGRGSSVTPQPQSAPANAPTGPRNAGKPGANYRGGGRGGHRGFHPYSR